MKWPKFKIIKTEGELDQLISFCKQTKYACIDFETTGLEFWKPEHYPTILGVSFQIGSAWIIPLGHFESPFKDKFEKILRIFTKGVLEDPEITKVAWNVKFEEKWLMRYGCKIKGRVFDGMLAKYLLSEERPHDLKSVTAQLIPDLSGYEKENDILVRKHGWAGIPIKSLAKYCAMDCHVELLLMAYLERRLIKGDFYKLFRNMYMPRSRGLAECEFEGALVDKPYLENLKAEYETKIGNLNRDLHKIRVVRRYEKKFKKDHIQTLVDKLQQEIEDISEEAKPNASRLIKSREDKIQKIILGELTSKKEKYEGLNFGSPKQMIELLHTKKYGFKFPIVKYTVDKKTRQESERPSTDEEALLVLKKKDKSGFIEKLLELRGLEKLYSTYIKGIYEILDKNNRVHPSFKLHGTVTGRLSCVEPNLQNIPRDCVGEDTYLQTDLGEIRIGDIIPDQEGVSGASFDFLVKSNEDNYQRITHTVNKGLKEMFEVELESGAIIQCTLDHFFLTDRGWLKLRDIYDDTRHTINESIRLLLC